jgi:methylated-DNA-[protein]-cysteine S-methyltransferase
MEPVVGSCRFGLWSVEVTASGTTVHRVRFTTSAVAGPVPEQILKFLAGKARDLSPLTSTALGPGYPYEAVYKAVREIPYGETATYGDIARRAGTIPRIVGLAMKRNPTPLVIPCHRVVAYNGIGGFTPSPEIKAALLKLEQSHR